MRIRKIELRRFSRSFHKVQNSRKSIGLDVFAQVFPGIPFFLIQNDIGPLLIPADPAPEASGLDFRSAHMGAQGSKQSLGSVW